jgi:ABC-type Fe3+ transport system substrate-binding protein
MANNINDPEKYVSATATVAGVVFSFAFAFFKSWAYEPGEWSDFTNPVRRFFSAISPFG